LSSGVEQSGKFAIEEVAQLVGDDGALASDKQEFGLLWHMADLVGYGERARRVLLAERDACLLSIECLRHSPEHDRLLSKQIGNRKTP
jgi:hypothetical protein